MPPIERDIVSIHPDGVDGAKEKIIRHLGDLARGQLDIRAVQRGVGCVIHEAITLNLPSSNINRIETQKNSFDIPDLNITTFHINIPPPLIGNRLPVKGIIKERIHFIAFPTNSKLTIHLRDGKGKNDRIHTSNILEEVPDAIAAITGPTSIRESDYPNNGFYYHGQIYKEFESAAIRKGAIAILENGVISLLTDEEKWNLIGRQYERIAALVGTSFYITNTDSPDNEEINRYTGRGKLSYIAQYTLADGTIRMVYIIASMSSRKTMKDYLDRYSSLLNARSYIALELEKDQAECFIRSKKGIKSIDHQGFHQKPEHYVITVPSDSQYSSFSR